MSSVARSTAEGNEAGGAAGAGGFDEGDRAHAFFTDDLPTWQEHSGFGAFIFGAWVERESCDDARAVTDAREFGIECPQPTIGFRKAFLSPATPLPHRGAGGMGTSTRRVLEVAARSRLIERLQYRQRIEFRDCEFI